MTRDRGIRSLLPPVVDPEEEQLQAEAKAAVMKRLDVQPQVLPAAMDRLDTLESIDRNITFRPEFFKNVKSKKQLEDEKFKRDFERDYGDKAIKKDVLNKINKNKRAGKGAYEGLQTHDIVIAENEPSIQRQVINYSPKKIEPYYMQNIHGGIDDVNAVPTKPFKEKNKKFNMNKHVVDTLNKFEDTPILKNNINNKPITSIDYINRMQHRYGEAELNESNKMKDAAKSAVEKFKK